MLNITNNQGNENQNHSEISTHTSQNGYCQTTSIGEDVEKRKPSCTVDGTVNWYTHYGKQYGVSSKN